MVEMIQGTATGRGDRPVDDIEMRISIVDDFSGFRIFTTTVTIISVIVMLLV